MEAGVNLLDVAAYLSECSIPVRGVNGASVCVHGVTQDSRRVAEGDLYIALPGTRTDGCRYIGDAARAGARAVLSAPGVDACGLPALWAEDPLRAAGPCAAFVFGQPAAAMDLIGVTGTNGKTSVSYLLESILRAAGRNAGVLGTIVERCAAFERHARLTTQVATEIQRSLASMRRAGVDSVVLEVSSHALVQHRVGGCRFAAGVFTNLTRDHLDYHRDEDDYFAAKTRLFREYLDPVAGIAVLNDEDARVASLAPVVKRADVWTYSTAPDSHARVTAQAVCANIDGMLIELRNDGDSIRLRTPLVGQINVSNIAAAAATALGLGIDIETVAAGTAACRPVPGRLERIGRTTPAVIVDYAHTPDALARTLVSLAMYVEGRLIVVFGCGGDRDRGKRALMGAAAAELADVVIATSDNPRSEDPEAILDDVEPALAAGMRKLDGAALESASVRGYLRCCDRAEAIRTAVAAASPSDIVLVAGKGHEDYQEINGVRHPLDDRRIVAELVSAG